MPIKSIQVSLSKSMKETIQRSMPGATQIGQGVDAVGTTTINLGTLLSATVTTAGWGYTSLPNCTIIGGGGNYGTVLATMNPITNTNCLAGSVASFTILTNGAGYTGAPGITCSGGRGSLLTGMIELGD